MPVDGARLTLGERGAVAYTDGACIKNPGGPAGWSVILVSVDNVIGENVRAGAARIENYGHIPRSPSTTNNRAEITAVLAALFIALPGHPLTIQKHRGKNNKVGPSIYSMKANPPQLEVYP